MPNKDEWVGIRCSDKEREEWERAAGSRGWNLSHFLREAAHLYALRINKVADANDFGYTNRKMKK